MAELKKIDRAFNNIQAYHEHFLLKRDNFLASGDEDKAQFYNGAMFGIEAALNVILDITQESNN